MKALRLILVAAALSTTGCYTYVPSSFDEVGPQSSVRARLAPLEAARLDDFVSEGTRSVDGEIVSVGSDSLLVLVAVHSELRGTRIQTLNQRVSIARTGVLDIEIRELDKGRTYATVAGAGLAIGLIAANRLFGDNPGGTEPPGLPPDEARVPLLTFDLLRLLGLGR